MYITRRLAQRLWLCLFILGLGSTPLISADPQHYPQFAQQRLDSAITVEFITATAVKQQLDTATPQVVVDVRDRESYDKGHIPGALSMPLETFPARLADLSARTPIVLY
jgi:3-mercaptopyruvate sulfurtransferase SseA